MDLNCSHWKEASFIQSFLNLNKIIQLTEDQLAARTLMFKIQRAVDTEFSYRTETEAIFLLNKILKYPWTKQVQWLTSGNLNKDMVMSEFIFQLTSLFQKKD